jgi:hypothetical protein
MKLVIPSRFEVTHPLPGELEPPSGRDRRGRRDQREHRVGGRVLEKAVGLAVGIVVDPAAGGIGRAGRDAGELEPLRVDERGVAGDGGGDDDRPRCPQRVEHRLVRRRAGRLEELHVQVRHLQPVVGTAELGIVEAGAQAGLQLRHAQRGGLEVAGLLVAARDVVDVSVLQAGHDHPALQVHDAGARPGEPARALVAADVDDRPVTHGHRLGDRVAGVDGVDEAVAQHGVRRLRRLRCRRGGERDEADGGGQTDPHAIPSLS